MSEADYQVPAVDPQRAKNRHTISAIFRVACMLVAVQAVVILIVLLTTVFVRGVDQLSWDFLTGVHRDDNPDGSGLWPAIIGSIVICLICGAAALPIGIGTAIFLEEFKPRNKALAVLHNLVQLNITNLAGVPSIVYGILGLTAFVYMFGLFGTYEANKAADLEFGAQRYYQVRTAAKTFVWIPVTDKTLRVLEIEEPIAARYPDGGDFTLNVIDRGATKPTDPTLLGQTVYRGSKASIFAKHPWHYLRLPFHKSVLSAGLTLALVVLPIVIISSQESIRAVPDTMRDAGLGLGCTRWQMVRTIVLPASIPGIMTGAILAMSRAVGEAAPLLAVMGGVVGKRNAPENLMDNAAAMPITIYNWARDDNPGFWELSATAIIVLLCLLLTMNSIAILLRYWAEKKFASR
ncbi:PstA family ABC transporter permease [Rosistilla oblonga]|uniref:Phosphate transport system permease protein PstA n=1 Tax=Rosistilla oblonga TaxID=2527990 RepID=A0A518IU72_9BACT|nr:PstA family ABC transporter permease [Rosistilla oblonga]QDV56645.1 Phosphate transport system permease protein PstA [Rosistilla oblonga]